MTLCQLGEWRDLLPSILSRPILSMSSADTMLPGNTANVPRKLTKYTM